MKVILNPDKSIVDSVNKALLINGGYCPCKTARNEDTRCMCKEFIDEIRSPDFSGTCSCGLYCKVL